MLHLFDSFGMGPVDYRGDLEGSVLTLQGPTDGGVAREVFDFSQDEKYLYRLDVSPDGKEWLVFTEGVYQKQGVNR